MTTTTETFPTFTVTRKGQPVTFTSAFATLDAAFDALQAFADGVENDNDNPTATVSDFVRSILSTRDSLRGPSPAQAAWVHKLATDAFQPKPESTPMNINLLPIVELLHKAAAAQKRAPVIKLTSASGAPVVLRLAGERSKRPGTVSVTDGARYGMSGRYFGSIDLSGNFHEGGSCCDEVRDLLTALAAHPDRVAGQHGVATGSCCFCSRPLSTKESRSVGYGPDCADRYGLPWGAVSAEVEAADAEAKAPLVAPVVPTPSADILAVLHTVRSYAEQRGAIGNEVLLRPVRTVSVWNEVELSGDDKVTRFGDVLRQCIRDGYLTHNGAERNYHDVTLTANGLQVLRLHD